MRSTMRVPAASRSLTRFFIGLPHQIGPSVCPPMRILPGGQSDHSEPHLAQSSTRGLQWSERITLETYLIRQRRAAS